MKLHILNDLHIEFEDFRPPATEADVVILAGDIAVGVEGLRWAEACFPDRPVIYVPGNHEFYHHDIAMIDDLKTMAAENIHVLDRDQVIINGVRFLGTTLWTDFALSGEAEKLFAVQTARERMADYSVIQNNGQRFMPEDAMQLHSTSRDWLAFMLAASFNGKTVVVTHHAPSSRSVHPRFARDLLNPAFASNLEQLMDGDRVALWVHGHMHDSFDYEVYGTQIVCNPRGYSPEALNPEFRADWIVEL